MINWQKKIIKKCLKIAEEQDLPLRQTCTHTIKKLSYGQRFRNHPKNKGKAKKADKKIKTIAGRLVRDVEGKLQAKGVDYTELLSLFKRVLAQKETEFHMPAPIDTSAMDEEFLQADAAV